MPACRPPLVVVLVLATILSIALWRAMQLRRAAAASKDHQSAVSEIVEQAQGMMLGMSPNTGGAASPVRGTPHRCSFTPVRFSPPASAAPRAKHVAVWRAVWDHVEDEPLCTHKVRAQQSIAVMAGDDHASWLRRGNAAADKFAKLGAAMHPHYFGRLEGYAGTCAELEKLAAWMGTALTEWPRAGRPRALRATR